MSTMLRKKEVYTNITPIPSHIPRQLAVDILHSHSEIITLNPLVLDHHPIKAPRDAAADEFYSKSYEISQRIQYIPGVGKMGSGKINFKGCFHDMPWGLQTHIYAPMNVDLKNKWRIAGNQQGEPPEPKELGLGAPAEGLYLREDVEIKCNITMVSFVKSETKRASKVLVDRMIKKAELLDAGVLHAMMEDGKLKTINPADRSSAMPSSQGHRESVSTVSGMPLSPRMPYSMPARTPSYQYRPDTAGEQSVYSPHNSYLPPSHQPYIPEQHRNYPAFKHHSEGPSQNFVAEMPGDYTYDQHHSSPHLRPQSYQAYQPDSKNRDSMVSDYSRSSPDQSNGRWSYQPSMLSSRPTSYSSEGMRSPAPDQRPFRSPGLEHKGFSAELPTMQESREEFDDPRAAALKSLEARGRTPPQQYSYNPQDYAFPRNHR